MAARWQKKDGGNDEVSYWQTISDVLSGLLLVVLLISILLALYMVRSPKDDKHYEYEKDASGYEADGTGYAGRGRGYVGGGGAGSGGTISGTPTPLHHATPTVTASWLPTVTPTVTPAPQAGGGGGGGGGGSGGKGRGDNEGRYRYADEGWGDYEGTEKAAVYVRVMDAETGKLIAEEGIRFTLTGRNGKQESLYAYYPVRVAFNEFDTTENGTFYFPEKLELGNHVLKEATEPEGYDASEDIPFEITQSHEWNDPVTVTVSLYPSRNVIRFVQKDAQTGAQVTDGSYLIRAAEEIMTADGTVRLRTGETACMPVCGEDGVWTSEELYLGKYEIVQAAPPEYHAALKEPVSVTVSRKQKDVEEKPLTLKCERTRLRVLLKDENESDIALPGAVFTLTGGGETLEAVTDANGSLIFDMLKRNTEYTLDETAVPVHYRATGESESIRVDGNGTIEGSAEAKLLLTNRTLRASVLIRDTLTGIPVPDLFVTLCDENGTRVAGWATAGNAHRVDGLDEGIYTLIISDREKRFDMRVQDSADIQIFEYRVFSDSGLTVVIILIALILAAGLFFALRMLLRRRNRRETNGDD